MDARNVDVIRAAAASLNASDVDGYLSNFHPDCRDSPKAGQA